MRSICDDLDAEHGDLDDLVAGLRDAQWRVETPSPGWAIRDQISHLWFFDQRALMALQDPIAFAADARWIADNGGTELSVAPGRSVEAAELPSMAARSFITARLVETWAHGQDVADALGTVRLPTAESLVSGPALDFCLVVTQRRNLADTRLAINGDAAAEWMSIAQAFAGGRGTGREPGQFTDQ